MANEHTIHVLGFSGSLRQKSYNTSLMRSAYQVLPEGMTLEIADLAALPLFNEDHEKPFPEAVAEFRGRIAQADALLIATPEYNSSISGVLKNALDWASRAPQQPLRNKPVAMMGASTGHFGSARAQLHLRQILAYVGALPLGKPDVLVPYAEQAFNADGSLVDEKVRAAMQKLLEALADWTRRVNS